MYLLSRSLYNDSGETHPLYCMCDTRVVDILAEAVAYKIYHVLTNRDGIFQYKLSQGLATA